MSQSDCQHIRELLSTALEGNEPKSMRESHSWGTVPSSMGTGAAGGSAGQFLWWAVPVVGSAYAGQSAAPKPRMGDSKLRSAAFLRIPTTEAAGCLPLQQG